MQSGKTLKNYKSRGAYRGVFDKFEVVFRSFLAENMRFWGYDREKGWKYAVKGSKLRYNARWLMGWSSFRAEIKRKIGLFLAQKRKTKGDVRRYFDIIR